MGRDGKTLVETGNTFEWFEIHEPITYFPFSTRIFRNRNMLLGILILILMLTLKSIKMKETSINCSIPPTTNLETNFTKSLKRDYPLHLQLTWRKVSVRQMQYCTLQSSFPWWIFPVARIDSYRVTGYVIATGFEPTHLVPKRTHNHLAKLAKCLSCVVSTNLYGVFGCVFLPCHIYLF